MPPSFVTPTDLPTTMADTTNLDGRLSRLAWDVKEYGAKGDGSTDDTSAIAAAVSAANAAGGGIVFFPAGTYITTTITIFSNVAYQGATNGATTLRLKNSTNVDLMATDQFGTLFGGSTQAGPTRFRLSDLTLDGNKTNQSTTSYPLSIYGSNFVVERCQITNGFSGGARCKWGTGGFNMESYWVSNKFANNNAQQLDFQGPHDSMFVNTICMLASTETAAVGRYGIHTSGNASGEIFTNCHVWGGHEVGYYFQKTAHCRNTVAEAAKVNVWFDASDCTWDGSVFGTGGTGPWTGSERGVQLGHTGVSQWNMVVRGELHGWASGDFALDFQGDNGSVVDASIRLGTATALFTSTPSSKTHLKLMCPDSPGFSQSTAPFGGTGVPSNSFAVNGSYYCRTDPSGTGTHIYFKSGGAWTGLTSATL